MSLSRIQHIVVGHLDSLEPGLGPATDLIIVEELCRGTPVAAIAKRIKCHGSYVVERWYQFMFPAITTDRGALTIDGRRDLTAAARARAGVPA